MLPFRVTYDDLHGKFECHLPSKFHRVRPIFKTFCWTNLNKPMTINPGCTGLRNLPSCILPVLSFGDERRS